MDLQGTMHIVEGTSLVDSYILLVLGIMVAAGILGGLANYFLAERHSDFALRDLFKYVLGVVAALMVPLFLNMISSNLLDLARTHPINLLVFGGFCLIAVIFSRRFLENLSAKLMQQIRKEPVIRQP
jgi:predicted membrane channel-forming protein YqfA (hemolysin III family)